MAVTEWEFLYEYTLYFWNSCVVFLLILFFPNRNVEISMVIVLYNDKK